MGAAVVGMAVEDDGMAEGADVLAVGIRVGAVVLAVGRAEGMTVGNGVGGAVQLTG